MLNHLSPDSARFRQRYESWEAAIRGAGKLLEDKGSILPSYTDAMVDMVRENGPYIVIMPGVALAHARPADNVFANDVALVTVEGGVEFGNEANDPARAVFAIAARSDGEHLVLFREIAKYVECRERVERLFSAARFEDLELDR